MSFKLHFDVGDHKRSTNHALSRDQTFTSHLGIIHLHFGKEEIISSLTYGLLPKSTHRKHNHKCGKQYLIP